MTTQLPNKALLIIASLVLAGISSVLFSLSHGSLELSGPALWRAFFDSEHPYHMLLTELRLPRSLSAFAVGGLLALAGALMQTLLRNPLADPYVLGLSGGASVGALIAIGAGAGGFWISSGSFIGALFSMLLVFSLAHGRGSWTTTRLLLTGIVVASGWGAVISFILATSDDNSLRGMMFWLMGDFSHIPSPNIPLLTLLIALALCLPLARQLSILSRGELQAHNLGINVSRLRWVIYIIASLLTGIAVSHAGSIGFIGLVVPHLVRLAIGNDQRMLLPASVLLGGTLLTCADTLARTVVAPQQLPVGVLTAILGVPVFLYLLRRAK